MGTIITCTQQKEGHHRQEEHNLGDSEHAILNGYQVHMVENANKIEGKETLREMKKCDGPSSLSA